MNPLISILIPIFQTKDCLEACIQSILCQTYTHFELILVDDGSTDGSEEICDDFAKLDSRVSVIHTANSGVSAARNTGLSHAKGDYIAFIDSDDKIAPDYLEYLLELLLEHKADISACNTYFIHSLTESVLKENVPPEITVYSCETALEKLLYNQDFHNSCWGKLYKKELFSNITYPEGHIYEDLGTTYKLVDRCDRIVYSSLKKYYYLLRKGSIMRTAFSRKYMDSLYFSKEILAFMEEKHPDLSKAAKYRLCQSAFEVLLKMDPNDNSFGPERDDAWKQIRSYRREFLFFSRTAFDYRCLFFASFLGKKATHQIWHFWLKIKEKNFFS